MSRRTKRRRVVVSMRPKWTLGLVFACLFALGLYFGIELAKPPPPPSFAPPPVVSSKPPPPTTPADETANPNPPGHDDAREVVVQEAGVQEAGVKRPRIALVIDDLGRSLGELETLGALGIPLSYAVLPFESRTAEVVAELHRRGAEVLCHLPMEAKGGANPGPGALMSSMTRDQLVMATRQALAAVPGAVGVNNHMGSSLSAHREAITSVLEVVAEQGLYFLDSRTSADTVGYSVARQLGIIAGERQVFLDTSRDPALIREQLRRLLELAERHGQAIAIAHPYPETLEILASEVPQVRERFELVKVSTLLDKG